MGDLPIIYDEDGNPIKPSLGIAKEPKKIKKFRRPLSPKVQKFLANLAGGMNQTQATLNAYDLPEDEKGKRLAASMAGQIIRKKNVQEKVIQIFEKNDIGLNEALQPIIKGLNAKKVIQYKDDVYVSNIDDLSVQIQSSDRALKLMGAYPKKEDNGNNNNYIQINNMHKDKYE